MRRGRLGATFARLKNPSNAEYSLEFQQRTELNITDRSVVRVEPGDLLAGTHIPDLQKTVLGEERAAVSRNKPEKRKETKRNREKMACEF